MKSGSLIVLAALVISAALMSSSAAAQEVFRESFEGNSINDWQMTTCKTNGGQRCEIRTSATSQSGIPAQTGTKWGNVGVLDYRPGCAGSIETRYSKSFEVNQAGSYEIGAFIGTGACDVCRIYANLFIDGKLVISKWGPTYSSGQYVHTQDGYDIAKIDLTAGTHTVSIGSSSSFACSGWFASWWENIVIEKEKITCYKGDCPKCNSNGVCDSGETAALCPSECSDFSVSIDPTRGVANKGDSKRIDVSLSSIQGLGSVTMSASGLPTGTTASFSKSSCSPSCDLNATIQTGASTPTGSHSVQITGTSGAVSKSAPYNLTVLPSSCDGNLVCNYPETQSSCSVDCKTIATMPPTVTPGEIVQVSVDFTDFRYLANDKVRIDLKLDGATTWNSANGCSIGGLKLGPTAGSGTTAWPSGTTSEDGHFKVTALCTVPSSLAGGAHTLSATPTIF